jgi:hypothetical protein
LVLGDGKLPSQLLRELCSTAAATQIDAKVDAAPAFAALAAAVAAAVRKTAAAAGGSAPAQLARALAACPVPGVTSPLEVVRFCERYVGLLVPDKVRLGKGGAGGVWRQACPVEYVPAQLDAKLLPACIVITGQRCMVSCVECVQHACDTSSIPMV